MHSTQRRRRQLRVDRHAMPRHFAVNVKHNQGPVLALLHDYVIKQQYVGNDNRSVRWQVPLEIRRDVRLLVRLQRNLQFRLPVCATTIRRNRWM